MLRPLLAFVFLLTATAFEAASVSARELLVSDVNTMVADAIYNLRSSSKSCQLSHSNTYELCVTDAKKRFAQSWSQANQDIVFIQGNIDYIDQTFSRSLKEDFQKNPNLYFYTENELRVWRMVYAGVEGGLLKAFTVSILIVIFVFLKGAFVRFRESLRYGL